MNSNDRFREEAITINEHYPSLCYQETEDGQPVIKGDIVLVDESGYPFDSYQVNIISSPDYPFRFPYVFETGDRIPINIDWHVFPSDGHCCIKAIPEEKLICKKGITLPSFIEKELTPYFYNQKFREENGYFLNERSHGNKGTIEFFLEVYGTSNLLKLVKGLLFIAEGVEPNRVSKCFCGSDLKYRKCHRESYRLLNQFSKAELIYYTKLAIDSYESSLLVE